jgi:pimeloyl-ACP methyl ester carboxylesterase
MRVVRNQFRRLVYVIFLLGVSFSAGAHAQSEQPTKVRVNGVELHYVERGRGEPLIFIHGASGDYRSWAPEMELFSKGYRVISYSRRYNYPNHNPRFQKNHSADIEADDLTALIHKLKLGRVHLVGNSYGAYAALVVALKHPAMVRSLVLAEPPVHQLIRGTANGEAVYNDFMDSCMKPAGEAFKAGDDERAMKILSDGINGPGRWDSLSAETRAARMQNSIFFKVLTSSSNPFPALSEDRLKRMTVPTLIVTGENTTTIHRLVDEKLASLLPNVRAVTIPKASHGSNRDNPEAYRRAVAGFLNDQKH